MSFKALIFCGDFGAPFIYRIQQPFNELKRYGVEYEANPILPLNNSQIDFGALRQAIKDSDLVILQRIISEEKAKLLSDLCFLEGVPILYETDDDYKNLPATNPCYFSTALGSDLLDRARHYQLTGNTEELQKIMPELEQIRLAGLEGYKKSLSYYTAITCTTEELAQTLRVQNKDVTVFPNQMDRIYKFKDNTIEESTSEGRMIKPPNLLGMRTVPAAAFQRDPNNNFEPVLENGYPKVFPVDRVIYSGTLSHREDFMTIFEGFNKLVEKHALTSHFVYLGDPYFYHLQRHYTGPYKGEHDENCFQPACTCGYNPEGDNKTNRRIHIEETPFELYRLNLRNASLGQAPLIPNVFNQSKSDLKAIEYAAWGIVPILPNFCTYTRTFVHGKTALFYSNEEEYFKCADFLLTNRAAKEEISRNAQNYVANYRLEKHHVERRHAYYKEILDRTRRPSMIVPNKVKNESSK